MKFLDTILDIIFPTKCIACGKKGTSLCSFCLLDSPMAERENAKWIFSVFDYRHPAIKKALWMLKYKNKKQFADIFAEILYEIIIEELSNLSIMENFRNAVLIPIPLSPKRYQERGYNQAELICRKLVELDQKNNALNLGKNILIKTKETEHQARIKNRNERLKNVIGSFAVKKTEQNTMTLKNKNVILIDDITTTGATLNEAKKILKQAGARKIIAFTIAH